MSSVIDVFLWSLGGCMWNACVGSYVGVSSLPVFQERVTVASPPISSTFLS